MKPFVETRVYTVGNDKGTPRVRIEGQILNEAGFEPHVPYRLKINRKTIVLSLDADGTHMVARKTVAPRKFSPLLVLHNQSLLDVLAGCASASATFRHGVITIKAIA
jgi:hypothetical protein